jgi:hypothetical protein
MKNSLLYLSATCALLLGATAHATPVNEAEAVSVAEWWYSSEISASTTALPLAEKQQRLKARNRYQIHYLLGRDNVQRSHKPDESVMAFVVTFEPSGFVVVSGDDALQPVPVFNATGSFHWDSAEKNYFTHFVGRSVAGAFQRARDASRQSRAGLVHTNWLRLRQELKTAPTSTAEAPSSSGPLAPESAGIYVLLPTATWGQGNFYNQVCVAQNGGADIATGCTATAMAIKFRYHAWPPQGNGSHSYRDDTGATQYSHSVDFSQQWFNWPAMPTNSLVAPNDDIARLMYACGVAVDMDYETFAMGGSGAWTSADAMNKYFRYRGTIDNTSGNPSDHVGAMAYSIRCGLPVVMSSTAHTVVACGYRDTMSPYFFLNTGWDGNQCGWYNLDLMPGGDDTIDRSYPYSSPNNFAYVDSAQSSSGNGDLQSPYKTLAEGQSGVPLAGVLMLKGGQYQGGGNTPFTLNKQMTVSSYLGSAIIRP